MKKRLFIIALTMIMILPLGLMSCKDTQSQTAVAYGMVHNQYAGQATITVVKQGANYKVDSIEIQEFLPLSNIGVVQIIQTDEQNITYDIHGTTLNETEIDLNNDFIKQGNEYYAKRIKIGDEVFIYTLFEAMSNETTEVYAYYNEKYSDLITYALYPNQSMADKGLSVKNSYNNTEFTKWYIENMSSGDYSVLKGSGETEYEIAFDSYLDTQTTKETWANKSENGYWPSTTYGLGWKENINKIETAIKTYGMEVYTGQEVKGEDGYLLGSNSTGATLNDYHEYMAVVSKAYNMAKEEMTNKD